MQSKICIRFHDEINEFMSQKINLNRSKTRYVIQQNAIEMRFIG